MFKTKNRECVILQTTSRLFNKNQEQAHFFRALALFLSLSRSLFFFSLRFLCPAVPHNKTSDSPGSFVDDWSQQNERYKKKERRIHERQAKKIVFFSDRFHSRTLVCQINTQFFEAKNQREKENERYEYNGATANIRLASCFLLFFFILFILNSILLFKLLIIFISKSYACHMAKLVLKQLQRNTRSNHQTLSQPHANTDRSFALIPLFIQSANDYHIVVRLRLPYQSRTWLGSAPLYVWVAQCYSWLRRMFCRSQQSVLLYSWS